MQHPLNLRDFNISLTYIWADQEMLVVKFGEIRKEVSKEALDDGDGRL